jgi:anti-anti-sigma regulatory factor
MQAGLQEVGRWLMANPAESRWSLRLPSDCSISAIRGVYELIRDAFRQQDRLEIDCSNVDKADVTSIQLLLSTTKTARAQGRSVVLTAISQTLRKTIHRAGFSSDAMINHHFHQQNDGT